MIDYKSVIITAIIAEIIHTNTPYPYKKHTTFGQNKLFDHGGNKNLNYPLYLPQDRE